MTIHDTFTEQTELARTYAEDGAFRSAARVLRELATKLIEHADWCDNPPVHSCCGLDARGGHKYESCVTD